MIPGAETPDKRGRTDLHTTGLDLDRNPDIRVREVELLASDWHVLRATTYDRRRPDGSWVTERRETYDRGNGATILLYDRDRRTVLLTRQFRYPVYVNDHPDGMLVETPAGLLDQDDPETAIRRETAEETGLHIGPVRHVFDLYMSPGSVTERLHFFAAEYDSASVQRRTHGVADEGEDIELVELGIDEAVGRIGSGIVDAKTVILLQWATTAGPFGGASSGR
jgi:nudix-type nucleoside diphosphatase (YffH/AdpP family)